MARFRVLDYMQVFRFWLVDITDSPMPVFLPVMGFSAITAPQMTMDTAEIKAGNWHFKRKFITGAQIEPIKLERGVQIIDSDFWRWAVSGLTGDVKHMALSLGPLSIVPPGMKVRKTLMLIHYTGVNPIEMAAQVARGAASSMGLGAGATNAIGSVANMNESAVGALMGSSNLPGKAWVLYNCIPIRYKGASDFNANETGVSIQELELQAEWFEEFSIGL